MRASLASNKKIPNYWWERLQKDLETARTALIEVADKNPFRLEEPKPPYIFQGFGDSSLDIILSAWTKRETDIIYLSTPGGVR